MIILFVGDDGNRKPPLSFELLPFRKNKTTTPEQLSLQRGRFSCPKKVSSNVLFLKSPPCTMLSGGECFWKQQVSPYIITVLNNQDTAQKQDKLKAGEFWRGWQDLKERETGLVFTTELGDHLSIATVWREYKKLVEQAGAPAARIHDLRHTFAVNGLQNGDDLKTVQENLGHATAAFTLDVYGHVSERMKEDSARRQQAYIESLTS